MQSLPNQSLVGFGIVMVSILVDGEGTEQNEDIGSVNLDSEESLDSLATIVETTYQDSRYGRHLIYSLVVALWLASLSIGVIIITLRYSNMSVTSIASRLDMLDERNKNLHEQTFDKIDSVESAHRKSLINLMRTVDELSDLEAQIETSLKELHHFLNTISKVAVKTSSGLKKIQEKN